MVLQHELFFNLLNALTLQLELIAQYTVGCRVNMNEGGDPIPKHRRKHRDQEDDQDGPKKGYVSPSHSFCKSEIDEDDTVNESYSDADNDAMDEIIECKSKENECDNAVNSSQNSFVDKVISANYVKEQPVLYLEPVSHLLVSNITEWCTKPPKRDEVKELFSQCLCPENIEGLKPVRINESFYKIIPPRAKIADQKIRGINQFITRAMGPLVKVFETLQN